MSELELYAGIDGWNDELLAEIMVKVWYSDHKQKTISCKEIVNNSPLLS